MLDFELARRMMVDGQVRPSDVTDARVIDAFLAVPRERFVGFAREDLAYLDLDLDVSEKGAPPRHVLKAMTLAKLIHSAQISVSDRVLDVGCATGYSSAILAGLAAHVVALEEDTTLSAAAERNLGELGVVNASVRSGPLVEGCAADGPFDVILINGAVDSVSREIERQLNTNGRLVCVVQRGRVGQAMLFRAGLHGVTGLPVFDCSVPVLPGFAEEVAFAF